MVTIKMMAVQEMITIMNEGNDDDDAQHQYVITS